MAKPYQRVLLKLSGEALEGERSSGLDPEVLAKVCEEIREVVHLGIQLAIVVGGGNIFRGVQASARAMERATADYMGMLATVINALALQDQLQRLGVACCVQSALNMQQIAEPFIRQRALSALDDGTVVIFAAGTGNPYFSTDTAAALRASEVRADVFLRATKVDGVYSDDPVKVPNARRFEKLTYQQVLDMQLRVMDLTAISLCMENKLPIVVFSMKTPGNILAVLKGEQSGTVISSAE